MAMCSGFSHEKLWFSIVMLNYQRVFSQKSWDFPSRPWLMTVSTGKLHSLLSLNIHIKDVFENDSIIFYHTSYTLLTLLGVRCVFYCPNFQFRWEFPGHATAIDGWCTPCPVQRSFGPCFAQAAELLGGRSGTKWRSGTTKVVFDLQQPPNTHPKNRKEIMSQKILVGYDLSLSFEA